VGGATFEQCVTESWLPEKAQARAENILAGNPDARVTAVLAPNDGLAGGIIQALKANGITDYVITGQDAEAAAIQRLKTGEQSMTMFVSSKSGLFTLVDVAVKAAKGEKIETNGFLNNGVKDVPAVLNDPVVMTKENWKSLLTENDLYDPAIHGE
jgi:D-xylose transport system substrate-binding protein